MTWENVWKIVLGILASVGGIGAIILAIVKFSSNIIAKRLEERYKQGLKKELEEYKSMLSNKTYISQAKFDVEFSVFRELSKVFFEMVKDISAMIPSGYATYPADKEEKKEYENKLYKQSIKTLIIAQDVLNYNIPFIPNDLYESYNEILDLCNVQIDVFERRWNALSFASQEEKETFSHEDYNRTREINTKFKELNENIRKYLATLDVLD